MMSKTDISKNDMSKSDEEKSNMSKKDKSKTVMSKSDMSKCDISNSDCSESHMSGSDISKNGNKPESKKTEFWSLWPKRTGQILSPKTRRSRKLFTKSVFISESDKVAVTVAQMSKSIDGSLGETSTPTTVPRIVITPATRDRSRSSPDTRDGSDNMDSAYPDTRDGPATRNRSSPDTRDRSYPNISHRSFQDTSERSSLDAEVGPEKTSPAEFLQCLAVPSSPSSDNVYTLASKGRKASPGQGVPKQAPVSDC